MKYAIAAILVGYAINDPMSAMISTAWNRSTIDIQLDLANRVKRVSERLSTWRFEFVRGVPRSDSIELRKDVSFESSFDCIWRYSDTANELRSMGAARRSFLDWFNR